VVAHHLVAARLDRSALEIRHLEVVQHVEHADREQLERRGAGLRRAAAVDVVADRAECVDLEVDQLELAFGGGQIARALRPRALRLEHDGALQNGEAALGVEVLREVGPRVDAEHRVDLLFGARPVAAQRGVVRGEQLVGVGRATTRGRGAAQQRCAEEPPHQRFSCLLRVTSFCHRTCAVSTSSTWRNRLYWRRRTPESFSSTPVIRPVTKYLAPSWRPARCSVRGSYIELPWRRISSIRSSCSLRATTRALPLFTSDVSIDERIVTSWSSRCCVVRFSIGQIAKVGGEPDVSTLPVQNFEADRDRMFSATR